MNWIERMYELKGKDLYSQNGEGLYLEYITHHIGCGYRTALDIGGGDGFYLSNTKHLKDRGWRCDVLDKISGDAVTLENIDRYIYGVDRPMSLLSIDIDGNDFWILDRILSKTAPLVVVAEFNASYTDSRTIKYNPDHEWAGDSYYGFTFDAGVKLAEKHGYKVIFQNDNMNMYMVGAELIDVASIPPVTYQQSDYFKMSERTDWITI